VKLTSGMPGIFDTGKIEVTSYNYSYILGQAIRCECSVKALSVRLCCYRRSFVLGVSSSVAPDVAGVLMRITVDTSSKLKLQLEISADTLDSCELKNKLLAMTN